MKPNTPEEQSMLRYIDSLGGPIEMNALENPPDSGWQRKGCAFDFSALAYRVVQNPSPTIVKAPEPTTEEKILACLERIEKAIANGPHITIVPTPVYPPTLPPTYFGTPIPGPVWPNTPTITCSSNITPK